MANEKNLIPQAHKLTVEEQSKGGKASAKKKAAINKLFELTGWNVAPSELDGQTQTAATDGFIKALEGKANDVCSDKQLKILTWWCDNLPVKDMD